MSDETREFESFDEAKRAAFLKDLMSFFQRKPVDLLPFEEVKERLHLKQLVDRGVQEVPLSQIVGSLGRQNEFNRLFMPREESLRKRWEEVRQLAEGPQGFPPVELYFVPDVYFVVDGHHRISVARSVGAETIEAVVKEFRSVVRLTPETSIEEIINKTALADFLETAGLVQKSSTDYVVTVPNGYEKLLNHISVHRYYRGIELDRPVSWEEAVQSWRRSVYVPMIRIIRKHKILEDFPGSTETDLYLAIMDHLHYLKERAAPGKVGRARAAKEFSEEMKRSKKQKWW
jgi:hypothetical protein